eukprot:72258-Rhodomonas_salina.1
MSQDGHHDPPSHDSDLRLNHDPGCTCMQKALMCAVLPVTRSHRAESPSENFKFDIISGATNSRTRISVLGNPGYKSGSQYVSNGLATAHDLDTLVGAASASLGATRSITPNCRFYICQGHYSARVACLVLHGPGPPLLGVLLAVVRAVVLVLARVWLRRGQSRSLAFQSVGIASESERVPQAHATESPRPPARVSVWVDVEVAARSLEGGREEALDVAEEERERHAEEQRQERPVHAPRHLLPARPARSETCVRGGEEQQSRGEG